MMPKRMILPLTEITNTSVKLVGGKALSLGRLLHIGVKVPSGFVVTTKAYYQGMSTELANEILKSFDGLGAALVAVRSSASAEDSQAASWAGQLESYLNITRAELISAIEDCWNSINSKHATNYATKNQITEDQLAVGVIVQAMVDSEVSGVIFTANPINESKDEYVAESVFGLGELLVQGTVTPETLIIDAQTGKILLKQVHRQNKMLIYQNGKNAVIPLPKKNNQQDIITKSQLATLYSAARQIANYYGTPQDIEWAFNENILYILQSRPITTLKSDIAG